MNDAEALWRLKASVQSALSEALHDVNDDTLAELLDVAAKVGLDVVIDEALASCENDEMRRQVCTAFCMTFYRVGWQAARNVVEASTLESFFK